MSSNTSEDNMMGLALNSSTSMFLVCVTSLQTFIGSVANVVVIITFLKAKELRKRSSDLLILNLAAADAILLTTFLPWLTYTLQQKGIDRGCYSFYESLNTFVQLTGGHTIFLIATDRFIAIIFPLQYKALVTRKVIYFLMILSWTLSVGIGILNFCAYSYYFHREFLFFWISYQLFLMILITFMYCEIFSTTLKRGREILNQRRVVGAQTLHGNLVMKITQHTFILVCFFYATFLPIIIYITHSSLVMSQDNKRQMATRSWIYAFSSLNSCINPFIYALWTKRFKKACYHVWCKRDVYNTNDLS